jgi:predicted metalloprotease with PDZ domain
MRFANFRGAAALAVTIALPAAAQTDSPVSYTVSPVMEGASLTALAVEIRFVGDADGETRLLLPDEWAGTDSLWRQVDDVQVEGATAVREDGNARRIITHAPSAPLAARYRVRSGYAGEPGFGYQKALPIILPGWFFFHGEGVFATPDGRQGAPARFAWRGFPAEWKIASDLDHLSGARPGTVKDVVEAAAIGGPDLGVVRRELDGAPVRVAMRGAWDFTPEAFVEGLAAVIQAENALWGDAGRPFFVPMAPLGGTGSGLSYTGTARSDAFSVASTPGFPLAQASRFLAHEYMHTWVPIEIGGFPEGPGASAAWLTEGWTDFYAGRALLRAGLWTPVDFVTELNRVLMRNTSSPVRAIPNTELAERFWSDANVHQLPYDRGHLLALLLDHRIRAHTGGRADMDDVMLAQREYALRNAQDGTRMDAAALFPVVALESMGIDFAAELARHVERGEPVALPADLFAGCATLDTVTQPDFYRGFDLAATEANGMRLTGVDPALPAYAAGMRDGMRLIRREAGVVGDPTVEVAYRVDDAGTERVFRYLPQGKARITMQRFTLTPEARSERCVRLMSGG